MRAADVGLQFRRQAVQLQQGFRVDADLTVDDELHARQAHAFVGQLAKSKASSGLPTFIMILTGNPAFDPAPGR